MSNDLRVTSSIGLLFTSWTFVTAYEVFDISIEVTAQTVFKVISKRNHDVYTLLDFFDLMHAFWLSTFNTRLNQSHE